MSTKENIGREELEPISTKPLKKELEIAWEDKKQPPLPPDPSKVSDPLFIHKLSDITENSDWEEDSL
jgi:hypothetical protein